MRSIPETCQSHTLQVNDFVNYTAITFSPHVIAGVRRLRELVNNGIWGEHSVAGRDRTASAFSRSLANRSNSSSVGDSNDGVAIRGSESLERREQGGRLMRSLQVGAICIGLVSTGPALAAEDCPFPVNVPAATAPSLASLIAKARSVYSPKGEFETTSAYAARLKTIAQSLPEGPIAIPFPVDELTKFDVDSGQVSVDNFRFTGDCLIFDAVLPAAAKSAVFGHPVRLIDGIPIYGTSYCATYPLQRSVGTPYAASNAYGARALVHVTRETDIGLYFGYGDIGQRLLPEHLTSDPKNPAFEFHATIEEAKSLKANAEIIYLVSPRAPFYTKGEYYSEPKINEPYELFLNTNLFVVQLHCVAIADRKTGKVFASRAATPQILGSP